MSRRPSNSSGSSHSFSKSNFGGSRSFGSSGLNSTKRISSSNNSSSSKDFDFRGENGAIIFEIIIRLLILAYDIFGIVGFLITLAIALVIYLLVIAPIVGLILLIGSTICFTLYFIFRKKSEVKYSIVDLLDNQTKYDYTITHSKDFNIYMLDKLRDKNLLDDRGNLLYNKIDQFHNSFDEIYDSYMYHR